MAKPRKVTTHRTILVLPVDLWKELRVTAIKTNRTMGAIVTEAIRAYLQKVGGL